MSVWHVLIYAGAAILALRSFVQLVTNYRAEYEQTAVTAEFTRMKEEREREAAAESDRPIPAEAATAA